MKGARSILCPILRLLIVIVTMILLFHNAILGSYRCTVKPLYCAPLYYAGLYIARFSNPNSLLPTILKYIIVITFSYPYTTRTSIMRVFSLKSPTRLPRRALAVSRSDCISIVILFYGVVTTIYFPSAVFVLPSIFYRRENAIQIYPT